MLARVEEAYTGGAVFAAAGGGPTRVDQRAVHALAADTARLYRDTVPAMLRWTEDVYRQVVADTAAAAVTGAGSQRDAAAAALDRLTAAGVGEFRDSGGRRWELDTYTDMATRTAVGRAHLAGTLDQYEADGRQWVIVSDSPEECSLCRPYEGKVLSISGDVAPPSVPGLTYAGTHAAATAAGLHHPNCTHRIHAYIPGLTRAVEWDRTDRRLDNPDGYADRQRQRELERRVRDSKRRVAALRPLGDTATLRAQEALLRRRRADLATFTAAAGRKKWVSQQRTRVTGAPPPPDAPKPGRFDNPADEPLLPHERAFVDRFTQLGHSLEWIPASPSAGPTHDFKWTNNQELLIELKSTKARYDTIRSRIQDAVRRAARHEKAVVKDHFIIDLGEQPLTDELRGLIEGYNVGRRKYQIRRVWVMHSGRRLEQITLKRE